jgi:hypothetical protein
VDLASQLIDQGIPSGYNDIGTYLDAGYGLKQNKEMALRFFRKAADLGNPDAQFHVAEQLAPRDMAPTIAKQMRQCAMDQGYGRAANILGVDLQTDKFYADATKAFQKGTAAGDSSSAFFLEHAFQPPSPADQSRPPSDQLYFLNLPNDPERSRRYKLIGDFLDNNETRNPKVPDIDQIVPLPPAKLPPWDGTFQWQKEQDASPAKPSDDLIERMSKAKNLDPATGLPIPPPPKTALGTRVKTGERCPESGDYCAWLMPHYRVAYFQRPFRKGDTMPSTYHASSVFSVTCSTIGSACATKMLRWNGNSFAAPTRYSDASLHLPRRRVYRSPVRLLAQEQHRWFAASVERCARQPCLYLHTRSRSPATARSAGRSTVQVRALSANQEWAEEF